MDGSQWIPHTTKSGKILYYINPTTGECKWQSQLNKESSVSSCQLDVPFKQVENAKNTSRFVEHLEQDNASSVPSRPGETEEPPNHSLETNCVHKEEDKMSSLLWATDCQSVSIQHVDNGPLMNTSQLASSAVLGSTEIWNNLNKESFVKQQQQQEEQHILQCPWCRVHFPCPNKLASHLRSHPEIDPLKCPVCSKEYASSTSLTTHLRIHTGEKPFTCSHCNKSFNQSSHLTTHMRVHTGEKPYKCPQCPKTFGQSSHLTLHVRIHNGEKPFQCGFCSKGFSHSSALSTHMRTHTGEKPFQCPQCPKRFGQSSHLKIHTRTHTGERPFQCHFCLKHFRQSCYLTKHLRSHSSDEKSLAKNA